METVNLQCSSFLKSLLQAENSMTCSAYTGTNLTEIHEEISELLDK